MNVHKDAIRTPTFMIKKIEKTNLTPHYIIYRNLGNFDGNVIHGFYGYVLAEELDSALADLQKKPNNKYRIKVVDKIVKEKVLLHI